MRTCRSFPAQRTWLVALVALFVFAAAACGGDDDDSSATVDTSDDDTSDTDTGGGGADTDVLDGDGAVAGASMTIDGVTYEATEEQSCFAASGFLGAAFTNADQTVTINVSLSPEGDPEPSTARVDDDSNPDDVIQWESGGSVVESYPDFAAVAVVGDSTVDGRSASGSATFVDTSKLVSGTATPVEGTFELRCADL